ncbi:aldehyde dehydrogenase family protein [Pseudomonas aeruginosa]|nr:aldehyde dehydrogenase family protein [Pseudomonas aeruginosa]
MRRLGELIDRNVAAPGGTGDPRHRPADPPDEERADPARLAQLRVLRRSLLARMNGHSMKVRSTTRCSTTPVPARWASAGRVSRRNVPFMTATWKTAPCLALGNTAVLKMSELSPLTANELGRLVHEAGIPPGVFNVVQGYGASAGDALVRHRDVRAVSFTGGTATGRRIMEAAGIKKYSMELGGKSPVLVFEDADLERALDAALFTIFSLNGERCTAGSVASSSRKASTRSSSPSSPRAPGA